MSSRSAPLSCWGQSPCLLKSSCWIKSSCWLKLSYSTKSRLAARYSADFARRCRFPARCSAAPLVAFRFEEPRFAVLRSIASMPAPRSSIRPTPNPPPISSSTWIPPSLRVNPRYAAGRSLPTVLPSRAREQSSRFPLPSPRPAPRSASLPKSACTVAPVTLSFRARARNPSAAVFSAPALISNQAAFFEDAEEP